MIRYDGRKVDQLRPISLTPDYIVYPEGSVLISMGNTKVLCNASVEASVPRWMKSQGKHGGWMTAEYALLPRATHTRNSRETSGLRGRTQEIKRMIGRSLRAGFDLEKLDGYTCIIDCDVLQADGGTRTASITGGHVAASLALKKLVGEGMIPADVFKSPVAAVSVGVLDGQPILDLNYEEDFAADVDLNVVMDGMGNYIEVQGTAEGAAFPRTMLNELLDLAAGGIQSLMVHQALLTGRI